MKTKFKKLAVGLALCVSVAGMLACAEGPGPAGSDPAPTQAQFKAVPGSNNPNQAKTNQQIADDACPLCGMFPDSPSK